MMPPFDATTVFASIMLLLAWRAGRHKSEEEEIIEAHELVQNALRDGDFCHKIEVMTGKDLRDQITAQELEDIQEHIDLLKMGPRRN